MAVEKSPIFFKHEVKKKQLRIENVLLIINRFRGHFGKVLGPIWKNRLRKVK